MKNRKRNITMIAVLLFVCAAVSLNWTYNQRWGKPDAEMVQAMDEARSAADAAYAQAVATGATAYFAEARLTRQTSRDEALALLQTAASSEAASQETIDGAMNAISSMATSSMKESQVENLLIAKGGGGITVAVPAPSEGLSEEAVARITDIVCRETEYEASQLSIIEVRG